MVEAINNLNMTIRAEFKTALQNIELIEYGSSLEHMICFSLSKGNGTSILKDSAKKRRTKAEIAADKRLKENKEAELKSMRDAIEQ